MDYKTISLLQRELLKVYTDKKAETSYSFPMMAQEIEDYWRMEMSGEIRAILPVQFRDVHSPGLFVEGKKNDNFRKYVMGEAQSMSPIRLWAALIWLAWDQNDYSSLTIDDIKPGVEVTQSKIISLLDEHLYENCDHEPMIGPSHFAPEYEEVGNNPSKWVCIGKSISERVLELRLYEAHSEEILIFEGQLLIGPDDAGYTFMTSTSNGESRMFSFIPQGDNVFQGGKIERFCLIEISSAQGAFRNETDLPLTSFVRSAP